MQSTGHCSCFLHQTNSIQNVVRSSIQQDIELNGYTEGQPVSAIYIVGLLLSACAGVTSVSSKN